MAHEIKQHDNVVLHKTGAWHGLGTVVENAPTPSEALKIAGLDWSVIQNPLVARTVGSDGMLTDVSIETHQANFRSDTNELLGVVGTGYTPVQNQELAEICESLAQEGDVVKLETAGSIRNGRKVWFLMKGDSFGVRAHSDDEIKPYILASNGHDGSAAVRFTPTTIRVVCSNTLHAVIPQYESESSTFKKATPAAYAARHTGDVGKKIDDIKSALGLYQSSIADTREMIDALAAREVNSDIVKRFFLECYTRDFGKIADEPKTAKEEKARDKAMDASNKVFEHFDADRSIAGCTAWNAFNSYSNYVQHDRTVRRKSDEAKAEFRLSSSFFGVDATRTQNAFALAMSI